MTSFSKNEPFVILLDLDHTIQGNILPQLEEYNLIDYINTHLLSGKKKNLKQNKDNVMGDFLKGLLRPYFKGFILRMKYRFPNVEFFVYTASEDKWAKYIVSIIETVINVRFNKRIFSRSDCILNHQTGALTKSINKLKPELFKILKFKYKLKPRYAFNHIYLIDNNYVLNDEESHMLIKCPHYNTTIQIDIFRSIPINIIIDNLKSLSIHLLGYEENNIGTFYKKVFKKSMNSKLYYKDHYWNDQLKIFKQKYPRSE